MKKKRAGAIDALDTLAKHFERLRDQTNDEGWPKPLPEIYTAHDMWDRAADMTRRTAESYRGGWWPSETS